MRHSAKATKISMGAALAAALACLIAPGPASGEEAAAEAATDATEVDGLTLQVLEERAVAHFPSMGAARARAERAEAALREVLWRPFSGIRVRGTFSPTPERRGDAVHSAQGDISFSDSWGVLVRTEVDLTIPLYTFGRLTAERRAAEAEIEVGRQKVRVESDSIRRRVQQAYHALLLARQTRSLLEEGQGYLRRAQRYMDRSLEEDEGDITEADRLEVAVLAAEVDARMSDARRAARLATVALRTLTGSGHDEDISMPPLEPIDYTLRPLRHYAEAAADARPELAVSQARVRAATARRRAARARFFPELRLVGDLNYAYSNVADDQQTPFAYDPFNHFRYSVGLTLHWGLDFMSDRARLHQAGAQLRAARADHEAARTRVSRRVEEAHINVDENQALVEARRRSRRASRGWLVSMLQGLDVGVLDPPELVDALKAYFEQGFHYWRAVAQLNASIETLERVAGLHDGAELPPDNGDDADAPADDNDEAEEAGDE